MRAASGAPSAYEPGAATAAPARLRRQLRRVAVVGTSGSGKTLFALALQERLGLRHVELDALAHTADRTALPEPLVRARVADAIDREDWVVDGDSPVLRDLIWSRADLIVWLDYPLPTVLWRVLKRTAKRLSGRDPTGHQETLGTLFFSRDSLLAWALRGLGRRRRSYAGLPATVRRFRSPQDAERWLRQLRLDRPTDAQRFPS